jgi:hypothetical protein
VRVKKGEGKEEEGKREKREIRREINRRKAESRPLILIKVNCWQPVRQGRLIYLPTGGADVLVLDQDVPAGIISGDGCDPLKDIANSMAPFGCAVRGWRLEMPRSTHPSTCCNRGFASGAPPAASVEPQRLHLDSTACDIMGKRLGHANLARR